MDETEGKSLARSVFGDLTGSHQNESTYTTETENNSNDANDSNSAANNSLDATKALQADSIPQQKQIKIDSSTVFFSMQPADFDNMFRAADKDSSNSLSKKELQEFKAQVEKEPRGDIYSPRLDNVAQLLIENYDQATQLVKSNYDIFDDRFTAKHYKSDPVAGMLSRQDFDMVQMFSRNRYVEDYSRDDHQSEMQRNSRACFLFATTALSISNAILSKRIPLLSFLSLGVGAVTAGLATNSLLNDHPTLREYKQRKNMLESWQLQVPVK